MSSPHFACALSTDSDARRSIRTALDELEAGLAGHTPDLVVAFATHHHGPALEGLGPELARRTGARVVLGCTAESVIGGAREVEGRPGLALWGACLPDTDLRVVEISAHAGEDDEPVFSCLPEVGEPEHACFLLLADPYSFPSDSFLCELNEKRAGLSTIGGMASGAMGPGQTLFFTKDGVRDAGALGLVLEGAIEVCPIVSQGCRPVGKPWVITECDKNLIKKLGGKPALEVLMETWNALQQSDQRLLQGSPLLGLAVDPTRNRFERGDFLVRGIMGLIQRDRAIAVADFVRRGQTVQLLVRDAASAGEDLRSLISTQNGPVAEAERNALGALLFSCNGRGTRMFGVPDHDAACVRASLGAEVPLAGFFAAGEIGPVGKQNYLHGFTASLALFRRRVKPEGE